MIVHDAKSARVWLAAWGSRAFALGRADRLVVDMERCAKISIFAGRRADAAEYRAAAAVVRDAQEKHRAG